MKSIFYIIIVLFMGVNLASCTPEQIVEEVTQPQGCCGDDGELPPPPPPPPGEGITGG